MMPGRTEDVFTRTIFTFECFNWQMRRPTLVVERLRFGPRLQLWLGALFSSENAQTTTPSKVTQEKQSAKSTKLPQMFAEAIEHLPRHLQQQFYVNQPKTKPYLKAKSKKPEINTNAIDFATGPAISCWS